MFFEEDAEEGYEANKDPMPQPAQSYAGLGPGAKKGHKQAPDRQWLTESLMTNIAGNAMALPVHLAIMQGAVCSTDFREGEGTDHEQTVEAWAALALMSS